MVKILFDGMPYKCYNKLSDLLVYSSYTATV